MNPEKCFFCETYDRDCTLLGQAACYGCALRAEFSVVPDEFLVKIKKFEMTDQVDQPDHYTSGSIECWDYLKDNMPREAYLGGLEWNIKKYLHRWRYKKNPLEDLKKARVYLDRLIAEKESE